MNLLVIGATGPTGREIVNQGLSAGHHVRALVRNPEGAAKTLPAEVECRPGDVLRSDSLAAALTGRDAVVCSLGSAASGPFKEVTLFSRGTANLLAAMRTAGVRRLVCITGIGAGESRGHGPWYYNWLVQPLLLRGVYRDKDRQEALVRESDADWTLVRPGLLTNGPARGAGRYRVLTDLGGVTAGRISRADVAGFCVQEIADGRYRRQAPLLTD